MVQSGVVQCSAGSNCVRISYSAMSQSIKAAVAGVIQYTKRSNQDQTLSRLIDSVEMVLSVFSGINEMTKP